MRGTLLIVEGDDAFINFGVKATVVDEMEDVPRARYARRVADRASWSLPATSV